MEERTHAEEKTSWPIQCEAELHLSFDLLTLDMVLEQRKGRLIGLSDNLGMNLSYPLSTFEGRLPSTLHGQS